MRERPIGNNPSFETTRLLMEDQRLRSRARSSVLLGVALELISGGAYMAIPEDKRAWIISGTLGLIGLTTIGIGLKKNREEKRFREEIFKKS